MTQLCYTHGKGQEKLKKSKSDKEWLKKQINKRLQFLFPACERLQLDFREELVGYY